MRILWVPTRLSCSPQNKRNLAELSAEIGASFTPLAIQGWIKAIGVIGDTPEASDPVDSGVRD